MFRRVRYKSGLEPFFACGYITQERSYALRVRGVIIEDARVVLGALDSPPSSSIRGFGLRINDLNGVERFDGLLVESLVSKNHQHPQSTIDFDYEGTRRRAFSGKPSSSLGPGSLSDAFLLEPVGRPVFGACFGTEVPRR